MLVVLDVSSTWSQDFPPLNRLEVAKRVSPGSPTATRGAHRRSRGLRALQRAQVPPDDRPRDRQAPARRRADCLQRQRDRDRDGARQRGAPPAAIAGEEHVVVLLTDGENNRSTIEPATGADLARALGHRLLDRRRPATRPGRPRRGARGRGWLQRRRASRDRRARPGAALLRAGDAKTLGAVFDTIGARALARPLAVLRGAAQVVRRRLRSRRCSRRRSAASCATPSCGGCRGRSWRRRWLLLLAPVAVVAALVARALGRRRAAAAALRRERVGAARRAAARGPGAMVVAALALAAVALARPVGTAGRERALARGADVVVAVDVSLGMLTDAEAPSRISRRTHHTDLAEPLGFTALVQLPPIARNLGSLHTRHQHQHLLAATSNRNRQQTQTARHGHNVSLVTPQPAPTLSRYLPARTPSASARSTRQRQRQHQIVGTRPGAARATRPGAQQSPAPRSHNASPPTCRPQRRDSFIHPDPLPHPATPPTRQTPRPSTTGPAPGRRRRHLVMPRPEHVV